MGKGYTMGMRIKPPTTGQKIANEIEQLRAERDEARREVSSFATRHTLDPDSSIGRATEVARYDPKPAMSFKDDHSIRYANSRGWDCFKENTNA